MGPKVDTLIGSEEKSWFINRRDFFVNNSQTT